MNSAAHVNNPGALTKPKTHLQESVKWFRLASLPPSLREGHKEAKTGSGLVVRYQPQLSAPYFPTITTKHQYAYPPHWSSATCQGLQTREARRRGRGRGVRGQGSKGFGAGNVRVSTGAQTGMSCNWGFGGSETGVPGPPGRFPGGRAGGEAAPRRTKSWPPAGPGCGPFAVMPDWVPGSARTPQKLQDWAGSAAFLTWVGAAVAPGSQSGSGSFLAE